MPWKVSDQVSALVEQFEAEVSAWPNILVGPHRFGGQEFMFGTAEVGHIHRDGTVDIPFTRKLRNVLVAEGLTEEHLHVPRSGWTTFRIRRAEDVSRAVGLMRLSYVRYLLKSAADPLKLIEAEMGRCNMSSQIKLALQHMVLDASRIRQGAGYGISLEP